MPALYLSVLRCIVLGRPEDEVAPSLPPRWGRHRHFEKAAAMSGIDYPVLDDALRDADARALFDRAVQETRDGTAVPQKLSRGSGFVVAGQRMLGTAVLEYGIGLIPADEFAFDSARDLAE